MNNRTLLHLFVLQGGVNTIFDFSLFSEEFFVSKFCVTKKVFLFIYGLCKPNLSVYNKNQLF